MFGSKNCGTVIAKGLKIVGTVTAEGLVEVNGRVDGELHCTSLVISRGAHVAGTIAAGRVVVDGNVEGPIQGGDVILKSKAHVVGDIHHQSLSMVPSGATPSRQSAASTRRSSFTAKTRTSLAASRRRAACGCGNNAGSSPPRGVTRRWGAERSSGCTCGTSALKSSSIGRRIPPTKTFAPDIKCLDTSHSCCAISMYTRNGATAG